ncbi:hypothetical protein [Legionella brunensis]|uniref:Uncharacterized protein n=1 Tax=Legionella brunensis TaxID=29422 RepID=A0A0W0S197_9GAMM|nr:hypothetical protein [Legionella brunensis]KTC76932.1 hypothetical protein Lbru_3039 [Legionella brunensis]
MPGLEIKRDIGLLDVDNTLIFGSEGRITYNDNLLAALKEAGIRDIYLFTSMTITSNSVKERQEAISYLRGKGFTVHGVITPSDIFWHLNQSLADDFLKEFVDKNPVEKLLEQEKYSTIKSMLNSKPAVAFATGLSSSPEAMPEVEAHSRTVNNVLGVMKNFYHEYKTDKGHMYALFAEYKPEWCNQIVVVDDDPYNIDATKQANEKFGLPLVTVVNRVEGNYELPKGFYEKALASLISKQHLKNILAAYVAEREKSNDSQFSWAALFQKKLPLLQEKPAITALERVLEGEKMDLSAHMETLRQGVLGSAIRKFVKSGEASALCGTNVNTVSNFITAMYQKVNGSEIPSLV